MFASLPENQQKELLLKYASRYLCYRPSVNIVSNIERIKANRLTSIPLKSSETVRFSDTFRVIEVNKFP